MKFILLFLAFSLFVVACSQPSGNDHSNHGSAASNGSAAANSQAAHAPSQSDHSTDHSEMKSSPDAASAPVELQFLDTMIAHHKGAVEMALLAEGRSAHPEVKELAATIIQDQEREIGKMAEWRNNWYDGKSEAINMDFPGMNHGMKGMDMKKLESLKGHDFDVEFLRQMIPHHEGAVEMAKSIRGSDGHPEVKGLATDIISSQEAEIKQMREWLAKWERK